ncbi:bifunctional glycosyltransferase/CDP-glycerol:glycerophosphate glycerophosphotransferase [Catenovulum agarivorans]|uniref:bifunctional glycosyltransferase/CDP-glycerol:glycerophosphate glycerophosphotransferase n=1 Tax=Catenovulum agarivorans TaxID=1172192 RepID=UPI0002F7A742|nr:bifunctional glycosyltransferase family 2 protein/CDP-glycerol:glycerophosphate glycerophosphotransferase [Catenovulum agarivorans]
MIDLSIVVPVYGADEFLKECVDSLCTGHKLNVEVIAINDGSPDSSLEILNDLSQRYSSLIVIDQSNVGGATTINRGLKAARGKYTMIVDCDDVCPPSSIDKLFFYAEEYGSDIVSGIISKWHCKEDREEVCFDSNYISHLESTNLESKPQLLQDGMYLGKLFKTEFLRENQIWMDPELLYADRPFMYACYASTSNVCLIPFVTYKWRQRGGGRQSITDQMTSIRHIEDRVKSILVSKFELQSRGTFNKPHLVDEHNLKRVFWHFNESKRFGFRKSFYQATKDYISQLDLNSIKSLGPYHRAMAKFIQEASSPTNFAIRASYYGIRNKGRATFNNVVAKVKGYRKAVVRKAHPFTSYIEKSKPNKTLIVFESNFGKCYGGNPKYIYEYLLKTDKHFQAVWVYQGKKTLDIPGNVIQVHRGSVEYFQYLARACYWVNNITFSLPVKPKHTTYLQTWHGTPLKRLGLDIELAGPETAARDKFLQEVKNWDYLIAANQYSAQIFKRAFNFENEMLTHGYPSNDLLVKADSNLVQNIKHKLKIPLDKQVILYAPTWRDDRRIGSGWSFEMDVKMNLERFREQLGDDCVLLVRFHHLIAKHANLSKYSDFVIDVSHYDDTTEILSVTDVLITDYSSIFFDFAVTRKPILFYMYDLERYKSKLRGFYIDPENELPGPVYKTEDDLIKGIQQIDSVAENYCDKYQQFIQSYCSLELGKSAEYVVEQVFKDLPDKY